MCDSLFQAIKAHNSLMSRMALLSPASFRPPPRHDREETWQSTINPRSTPGPASPFCGQKVNLLNQHEGGVDVVLNARSLDQQQRLIDGDPQRCREKFYTYLYSRSSVSPQHHRLPRLKQTEKELAGTQTPASSSFLFPGVPGSTALQQLIESNCRVTHVR
jgi:hypothetical protein